MPRLRGLGALLCLTVVVSGCSFTETSTQQFAGATAGELSAAATTLSYLHTGKLTEPYARSAFADYETQLQGADQQIGSMSPPGGQGTVRRLMKLFKSAEPALSEPCLDSGCHWQTQVRALHRAASAFVKAGSG